MPEPFKNFFNPALINGMAGHFHRVWPDFDRTSVYDAVREFQARSRRYGGL